MTTYGELARALRLRGGARAVGYAMAACPNGRGIPWHRVIGAGGKVRMPEPYASLQRKLLTSEKVEMDGSRIDMKRFGWSPAMAKRPRPKRAKRSQIKRG